MHGSNDVTKAFSTKAFSLLLQWAVSRVIGVSTATSELVVWALFPFPCHCAAAFEILYLSSKLQRRRDLEYLEFFALLGFPNFFPLTTRGRGCRGWPCICARGSTNFQKESQAADSHGPLCCNLVVTSVAGSRVPVIILAMKRAGSYSFEPLATKMRFHGFPPDPAWPGRTTICGTSPEHSVKL